MLPPMAGCPRCSAVITKDEIKKRVRAMGRLIADEYAGRTLTTITVLDGAVTFAAEIQRSIDERVAVLQQYVRIKSYEADRKSDRKIAPNYDLLEEHSIRGRDVIILEDILDTGQTLVTLTAHVRTLKPRSIRTVVFLRKPDKASSRFPFDPDLVGFDIEDTFVIGYGMDYRGYYRNYSYVAEFDHEIHQRVLRWLDGQGRDDPPDAVHREG